jgi:hypothetical protein
MMPVDAEPRHLPGEIQDLRRGVFHDQHFGPEVKHAAALMLTRADETLQIAEHLIVAAADANRLVGRANGAVDRDVEIGNQVLGHDRAARVAGQMRGVGRHEHVRDGISRSRVPQDGQAVAVEQRLAEPERDDPEDVRKDGIEGLEPLECQVARPVPLRFERHDPAPAHHAVQVADAAHFELHLERRVIDVVDVAAGAAAKTAEVVEHPRRPQTRRAEGQGPPGAPQGHAGAERGIDRFHAQRVVPAGAVVDRREFEREPAVGTQRFRRQGAGMPHRRAPRGRRDTRDIAFEDCQPDPAADAMAAALQEELDSMQGAVRASKNLLDGRAVANLRRRGVPRQLLRARAVEGQQPRRLRNHIGGFYSRNPRSRRATSSHALAEKWQKTYTGDLDATKRIGQAERLQAVMEWTCRSRERTASCSGRCGRRRAVVAPHARAGGLCPRRDRLQREP